MNDRLTALRPRRRSILHGNAIIPPEADTTHLPDTLSEGSRPTNIQVQRSNLSTDALDSVNTCWIKGWNLQCLGRRCKHALSHVFSPMQQRSGEQPGQGVAKNHKRYTGMET